MIYAADILGIPFLAKIPPWVFLIVIAAASSYWNWRAAIAFIICVVATRFVVTSMLPQPIVGVILIYSVMAAVTLFYWDQVAGTFFAIIALLAAVQLWVPAFVIVGEIAFIVGVTLSAMDGGSGGIYGSGSSAISRLPSTVFRISRL